MKDTEAILTRLGINNPTDASLVRLAALANSMPEEAPDTLVGRMAFTHPRDRQLATAIVEVIRANAPAPGAASNRPDRRAWFVAAALAALAIGAGVWGFQLARTLSTERSIRAQEIEQFGQRVLALQSNSKGTIADLQTATSNAQKSSDAATKAAEGFAKTLAEHALRISQLTAENEHLKAELAATKTPKN